MLKKKNINILLIIFLCFSILINICLAFLIINPNSLINNKNDADVDSYKSFDLTIKELSSNEVVNITKNTTTKDLTLFGSNLYPEVVFDDNNNITEVPESINSIIEKDKVVLRDRYNGTNLNSLNGSVYIGGITHQDNITFQDARLVYISLVDIVDYEICGLSVGMNFNEIQKSYGMPMTYSFNEESLISTADYKFEDNDCINYLTLDFKDNVLYRITLNIDDHQIYYITDEEFNEYLDTHPNEYQ